MNKRRLFVIPIAMALISMSLMVSSMGVTSLQVQQATGTMGTADSPVAEQSPVALTLFRTFTGKYGYVTAGVGVRNTGRGTISLTVPKGTSLAAAYLYWVILANTTAGSNDNKLVLNGIITTGSLIGTGPTPCWLPPIGRTYRADVAGLLGKTEGRYGISYGLEVGGMASYYTDGSDPWTTGLIAYVPAAESAHLVLIYSDSTMTTNSVITIYNGYYEQSGGVATFAYAWPARTTGAAMFSHLTSDGQVLTPSVFTKSLNLTVGATNRILDQGTFLNGKDPSITSKATYKGSLSDTNTYVVTSQIPIGGSASTLTYNIASDCIVWSALIFATGTN